MGKNLFENHSSRALENIAKMAKDGKKEVIEKIDPMLIDEHPDNEYLFGMPEEGIESLREAMIRNVKDDEIVCDAPILVWRADNGRYLIYSGHLRRRAFIAAGGKKIPAIIREMPDEMTKRRMLLGANIYGRNVNPINSKDPIHTARQILYMKETLVMEGFTGSMRDQLAKEFHTSGSTIQRYESFHKLPESVQEKVQNGDIPDTVAQAMGSMEPESIQKVESSLDRLKEKDETLFSRDNAMKIVTETKKGKDPEEVVSEIVSERSDQIENKKESVKNEETIIEPIQKKKSEVETILNYFIHKLELGFEEHELHESEIEEVVKSLRQIENLARKRAEEFEEIL